MSEPSLQNENKSAIGSPADASEATAGRHKVAALFERYHEHAFTTPLEVAGFWTAVVLPFLYMPMLFAGISGTNELLTFFGLLAFNLAALMAGHGHKRS